MTNNEHRVGVVEMNLVIRHLKLQYLAHNKTSDEVLADKTKMMLAVDQSFGVDKVSYDEQEQTLNVAYDASHFSVEQLEDILDSYNFSVAHDWWTKTKESYYKFTDQNIKDNSEHQPSCCHKPPAGKK